MIVILGYIFLGIFVLTSLLTLASLPGWIKIPDKYRSQLFKALLLEVIGAVIILFGNAFLRESNSVIYPDPVIEQKSRWVAWDLDSSIFFQPKIAIDTTSYTLGMDTKSASGLLGQQKLSMQLKDQRYMIRHGGAPAFGYIPNDSLRANSFFNGIKQVDKINSVAKVKFRRAASKKWRIAEGGFLDKSPFYIEVNEGVGTSYKILQKRTPQQDATVFSSENKSNIIDEGSRLTHLLEDGRNFYMFYIDVANNKDSIVTNRFIRFVQMKLEPIVK